MPENLKQRLINPLTLSIAAVAMPAMILIAALAINGSRASSAAGTTAGAPVVNDVILAQTDEPPADTPGIAATTETAGPAEAASTGEAPGAAPAAPQEGKLNIVGMVPLPGHKLESQIVLFFDHEIVLPLSPEGTPVQPFRIEPELEGDFQTGPNYVAFTLAPNQDLPPNEYYDVRVDRDIRSEDGRELNPGQTDLRVATFAFEPQRIWLLEKNEDRTVLGILLSLIHI